MPLPNLTPGEQVRLLRELAQATQANAEERNKSAEFQRKYAEERQRAEQEQRRAEEQQRRAEEQERKAEEQERKAEEERRKNVALERIMSEDRQKNAPLPLPHYIDRMEDAVFSTFVMERNSSSAAGLTKVYGKLYPRFLRPWTGFDGWHMTSLNKLRNTLGNRALFESVSTIEKTRKTVLAMGPIGYEGATRQFVQLAIEQPASEIVSAYLRIARPDLQQTFTMLDNRPKGSSGVSAIKKVEPDRWAVLKRDNKRTTVLVGEYKTPQNLKVATLRRVMATNPGDAFFNDAIRLGMTPEQIAASPARVSGHVLVARALCQTYHYMISAGCEYGYIASGDSLIFLRIPFDSSETLYYHPIPFKIPKVLDADERRRQNHGQRAAHQTAVAYLSSLCLWATESRPRLTEWIKKAHADSPRWPRSEHRQQQRMFGGGDGADDSSDDDAGSAFWNALTPAAPLMPTEDPLKRGRSLTRNPHGSKRTRRTTTQEAEATGTGTPEVAGALLSSADLAALADNEQPPTLPYCTHACLLGIVRGLALDNDCPNVALHRAARKPSGGGIDGGIDGGTDNSITATTTTTEGHAPVLDGHALTPATLQLQLNTQMAVSLDKDIECLDTYGCAGRYGTAFKITVTGYGYTLVGKAVEKRHSNVLLREAAVYNAIPELQGRLVPVFLGTMKLAQSIPRLCRFYTHMMLMSYAGRSFACDDAEPDGVDVEYEIDRSTLELERAGIYNEDVRPANLSWNAELRRVMHFDFDQAEVYKVEADPKEVKGEVKPEAEPDEVKMEVKTETEPNVAVDDEPLTTQSKPGTELSSSLLSMTGRERDHSDTSTSDDRAAKRMRTDEFAVQDADTDTSLDSLDGACVVTL